MNANFEMKQYKTMEAERERSVVIQSGWAVVTLTLVTVILFMPYVS